MPTILGLDLGTNSIGWGLIEYDTDKNGNIGKPIGLLDAGAYVFPEGVARTPQGHEMSRTAQRRTARSVRRLYQRRSRRLKALKRTMQESGLVPPEEDELETLIKEENPYDLRARGIKEQLTPYQFGRALYHLAQHRGFKSNRKSVVKNYKSEIEPQIKELQQKIEESGCSTLGEYLSKLNPHVERIRGKITSREMYENEFDCLWEKQCKYYPGVLTPELRNKIHQIIFFQRSYEVNWERLKNLPKNANAWRAPQLGMCEYEKGERRSPRWTWYAQRFRMLQDINNLEVTDMSTGEIRLLSDDERKLLVANLGRKEKMTFDEIRNLLGFTDEYHFNLEEGNRKSIKGNSAEWNLRVIFKKGYDNLSVEIRDNIIQSLLTVEDKQVLRRLAYEKWGMDEKAADRLLSTKIESGYLHLSEKALKRLLLYLENGCKYMEAVVEAGYQRRDQRPIRVVDKLRPKDIPDLPNPFVRSTLHQIRRVLNELINTYGKPAIIRVEMARELKNSKERRNQIALEQSTNKKRNEEAKKDLQDKFKEPDPSQDDITKYKLWKECDYQCPYTGKTIPPSRLLTAEWQIEHILPRYRSLDNSYMNKTLCWAKENTIKRNKTPWEAYGHTERWGDILERIKKLPKPKRDRFLMKEIPDGFVNHHLNDTAYISREVKGILEKLVGQDNVQVSKGRITASLRRMWGLNPLLGGTTHEKNRQDHRHHAIDAIVIALTDSGILKQMSDLSAKDPLGWGRIRNFPAPWPGFLNEVGKQIKKIIVPHKAQRLARGALHEGTNYGILKNKTDNKGRTLYAVRKHLDELTKDDIKNIADPAIRKIIRKHLRKYGVDPEGGSHKSDKWKQAMDRNNPPLLPNKSGAPIPIKKVRLHVLPAEDMIHLGNRAVEKGGNDHIIIFEYTDGKKRGKWGGEVVPRFDAAQRARMGEPIVRRELGPGRKFIMSLRINEMVRIKRNGKTGYYRIRDVDAGNKRVRLQIHYATKDIPPSFYINPNPLRKAGATKVEVDVIGRITPAHD